MLPLDELFIYSSNGSDVFVLYYLLILEWYWCFDAVYIIFLVLGWWKFWSAELLVECSDRSCFYYTILWHLRYQLLCESCVVKATLIGFVPVFHRQNAESKFQSSSFYIFASLWLAFLLFYILDLPTSYLWLLLNRSGR